MMRYQSYVSRPSKKPYSPIAAHATGAKKFIWMTGSSYAAHAREAGCIVTQTLKELGHSALKATMSHGARYTRKCKAYSWTTTILHSGNHDIFCGMNNNA